MSRLPRNVFDNPFKSTTLDEEGVSPSGPDIATDTPTSNLSVVPEVKRETKPTARSPGRKHTVYLTDEQILGLNVEIFEMRRNGKTAREANLTKVIAAAVDYYLARAK